MSYIDDMIASRREAMEESMELTPELVSEFKDAMLECTMNVLYTEEEPFIIVSEGANIEMTKAFKDRMGEIISHMNAASKANGSKDWETSREELKKTLKATNDLENDIKKLDFTVGSAFFGLFVGHFVSKVQMFIPNFMVKLAAKDLAKKQGIDGKKNVFTMLSYLNKLGYIDPDDPDSSDFENGALSYYLDDINKIISTAGDPEVVKANKRLQVANTFKSIVRLVKEIRGLVAIFGRYRKGDTSKEALNLYRNKMLMVVSDLKKVFSAMIKNVEKKIEIEKSAE